MTPTTHSLTRCAWTLSLTLLLTSCSVFRLPKVSIPNGPSARAPQDNGTPAVVASDTATTTFDAPAGSTMSVETRAALPATSSIPAIPETRIVHWTFPALTRVATVENRSSASSGTIDTSVAKHRIDIDSRRFLLYIAAICGAGGIIARLVFKEWPTIGNALIIAGACAFAAWRLAEIPTWLWMVVLGIAAAIVLGYKRAEWDRNGDGVPDILQK